MVSLCLTDSRYTMTADVYVVTTSRDPDTAQLTRTWVLDRSVRCQARGILGGGIRVVGSTERFVGNKYEDVEWVKMQVGERLSKRSRVTNIKQGDLSPWLDDDGDPIVFDVMGATPVIGPFGTVSEYDMLLYRTQDKEGTGDYV